MRLDVVNHDRCCRAALGMAFHAKRVGTKPAFPRLAPSPAVAAGGGAASPLVIFAALLHIGLPTKRAVSRRSLRHGNQRASDTQKPARFLGGQYVWHLGEKWVSNWRNWCNNYFTLSRIL
jgi:hypothetical protein